MNKNFYGYCTNYDNNSMAYQVIVQDVDITNIARGDLLTVFFALAQENGPNIRLKLYLNDTEHEIEIADGTGTFVKTLDVDTDGIDEAWQSGETVIFVYTKKGDEDLFYWELVDSAPATTDVYGVVKLFNKENLDNVLNGSTDYDDEALTPAILKELYYSLIWEPAEENGETLGYLSLNNGTNSVEITYPLEDKIQEAMSTIQNITHTGQLINNGNGGGSGYETDTAEPFITKMVPENLYFNNNQGLANNGGNPKLKLNDTGIQIVTPLTVSGATQINNSLTTTGHISAGAAKIVTGGEINGGTFKGGTIYEGGVSLVNKYSKKLEVFSYNTGDIPIEKNASSGHKTVSIAKENYRALGCVGYNVNDKSGRSPAHFDPNYANVWECYLTNSTTLQYCIYNISSSKININMTVYILYVRV